MFLAQDILSPGPFPSFDQSAMDGYAFCYRRLAANPLTRGWWEPPQDNSAPHSGHHQKDFVERIPPGADTVVMQEHVQTHDGVIHIENSTLIAGASVRKQGSQIQAGGCALPSGHTLQAGYQFRHPWVWPATVLKSLWSHIVVTGSELLPPGAPAEAGKVYESTVSCCWLPCVPSEWKRRPLHHVPDDPQLHWHCWTDSVRGMRLFSLRVGVSVGDYDVGQMAANPFSKASSTRWNKTGSLCCSDNFIVRWCLCRKSRQRCSPVSMRMWCKSLLKASGISHAIIITTTR